MVNFCYYWNSDRAAVVRLGGSETNGKPVRHSRATLKAARAPSVVRRHEQARIQRDPHKRRGCRLSVDGAQYSLSSHERLAVATLLRVSAGAWAAARASLATHTGRETIAPTRDRARRNTWNGAEKQAAAHGVRALTRAPRSAPRARSFNCSRTSTRSRRRSSSSSATATRTTTPNGRGSVRADPRPRGGGRGTLSGSHALPRDKSAASAFLANSSGADGETARLSSGWRWWLTVIVSARG